MSKPKLSDEKIMMMKRLAAQLPKLSIDEIYFQMEDLGMKVGRGSVQKYIAEWKEEDRRFELHEIQSYGLDWEAAPYLLEMLRKTRGRILEGHRLGDHVFHSIHPSIREVRWWWHIHLALPYISQENVFYIAKAFMAREMANDLLAKPLYMADLEALLEWQPWKSDEAESQYYKAIESEIIDRVASEYEVSIHFTDLFGPTPETLLSVHRGLSWPNRDFPHLLPTDAFEESEKMALERARLHAKATVERYVGAKSKRM